MLIEVLRESGALLRLRVENEVILLSVAVEAVYKDFRSSSDVSLIDSSCVVADGSVVAPLLVN